MFRGAWPQVQQVIAALESGQRGPPLGFGELMGNQVVPSPIGPIPEGLGAMVPSAPSRPESANIHLEYSNDEQTWYLTNGTARKALPDPPSAYPGSFPGMWQLTAGILSPVGLSEPTLSATDELYNQPLGTHTPQTGGLPGTGTPAGKGCGKNYTMLNSNQSWPQQHSMQLKVRRNHFLFKILKLPTCMSKMVNTTFLIPHQEHLRDKELNALPNV